MALFEVEENQNPFNDITVLTSSDNLNDIKDFGLYSWSYTSLPANVPDNNYSGQMEVTRYGNSSILQTYNNGTYLWSRYYSSGTWSTWKKLQKPTVSTMTATYTNSAAVTIAANNSQSIPLSTTDDTTGYTLMGLINYNLFSGQAAIGLACKAISVGNIVIENLSSSSITISKNAITVSARFIQIS